MVIPENKKIDVLKLAHDHPMSGHLGVRNTHQKISNHYYWPGQHDDVTDYVKRCHTCQKRRKDRVITEITPSKITPIPFYHISIDVQGPLPITITGKRYIVVAVDFFTKYVEARALESVDAQTIAQFIHEDIICRHGIPNQITSDRGTEFVNELITTLTKVYHIKHIRATAYHPQGNGQIERMN